MKSGQKHTLESREKMKKAHLGKKLSNETINKLKIKRAMQIMLPRSDETKLKLSLAKKEWYKNHISPRFGIKQTEKAKMKISETRKKRIAEGKIVFTEETRRKMSKAGKGRKFTDEHKRKLSEALKGKCVSENQKLKQSLKMKGRHCSLNTEFKTGHKTWIKGKHHTEKTKRKISMKNKGKIAWNMGKIDLYKHSLETKQKMSIKHRQPELLQKTKEARLKQIFPLKDTSIEIILQNFLKELNIKFETHKTIIGQPDIFIEPNIVIFADGCYWHGCELCFDRNKISDWIKSRKVADMLITSKLQQRGYVVIRLWEHEIKFMCLEEFEKKLLEMRGVKL